jgi:hypothetical protein
MNHSRDNGRDYAVSAIVFAVAFAFLLRSHDHDAARIFGLISSGILSVLAAHGFIRARTLV